MNESFETLTRHQLTLEGLAPYWAALLAVGLAWGVWRMYGREIAKLPQTARRGVRLLRAAALILLILAFMNPTWEIILAQSHKPLVAIAVDASRSMELADAHMRPEELVRRAVALGELDRAQRSTAAMACAQALRAAQRRLLAAEAQLAAAQARARHAPNEPETSGKVAAALDAAEAIRKEALEKIAGLADRAQQVETALSADAKLLRRAEDARRGLQRLAATVLDGFLPQLYAKARAFAGSRLDGYEIEEAALETADTAKLCRQLAAAYDRLQDEADALLLALAAPADKEKILALGKLSRREAAQRMLNAPGGLLDKLGERYRVRLYGLHDRLELLGLDAADRATWDSGGAGSDYGSGLEQLAGALAHENLAGVLLLGDGRHTDGPPPQETARALHALGVPMHTAGIGSAHDPVDLVLAGVQAPQTLYRQETLEVRAFVKATGFQGAQLKAALFNGESELSQAQATVPAGAHGPAVQSVELRFPPCELPPGRHRLEVRLAPVEGDPIPQNNRVRFQTRVIERRLRALVVEGMPRWQHASLAAALRADPNVEVREVVLGTQPERKKEINAQLEIVLGKNRRLARGHEDGQYPPAREDLFEYDMIFLGDFPILELSYEEQQDLADFVRDRGGSLILCAGFRSNPYFYEDSALGELLPVTLPLQESDDEHLLFRPYFQDGYALELTPAGRASPLCRLRPDMPGNLAAWQSLPKSHWRFHGLAAKPAASVLATTAGEKKEPVLAAQPFGLGRVLYIGLDDVWRWKTLDESFSEVFWQNVLRWAVSGGNAVRASHLAVSTDRDAYGMGDPVVLGAQVLDDDRIGVGGDILAAAVFAAGQSGPPLREVRLEPLAHSPGLYGARLENLPEGPYVLRLASALYKEEAAGLPDLPFAIGRDPDHEFRDVTLNAELLEELAQQAGGAYFSEDRLHECAERLPQGQPRETTQRTSRPLWNNLYYLLLVGCLFTAEWVVRKRNGLL